MPKRNAKGRFVKGGHATHHKASRSRAMTVARPQVTVIRTSTGGHRKVTHHHKGKRRGRGSGGGMKLTHLALAGAGLAWLTSSQSPIQAIPTQIAKLPGTKTFGNAAIAGLACLAADRFVKRNRWLRAAGVVGVVLGAVQVGTKGKDFQWVGDPAGGTDTEFSGDIEPDEFDEE